MTRVRSATKPREGLDRIELRTLAVALLASLLLWNLPFGGVLLYPFKLLATWLHELSHGLAMLVTGAGFERVLIYRDTSGLAFPVYRVDDPGQAVIAAAGYMGTPLWGGLLLVITPTPRAARWALAVLAVLMGVSVVTVVGNEFGQMVVLGMAGVAAGCALLVPGRWRLMIAHFVAAQSCVNALLDIRVLFRPQQVVNGENTRLSDAHAMAAATFGTTETWAVWTWAITWQRRSLAPRQRFEVQVIAMSVVVVRRQHQMKQARADQLTLQHLEGLRVLRRRCTDTVHLVAEPGLVVAIDAKRARRTVEGGEIDRETVRVLRRHVGTGDQASRIT